MVIPIGDENPRASTPWVSRGWAAAVAAGWPMAAVFGAPSGFAGFLLSPVLAPDPLSAGWTVLALLIFADNVEDLIGPYWMAVLLTGIGWLGSLARVSAGAAGVEGLLGGMSLRMPFCGAAAAAVGCAVAYAVVFPLHQITFAHVFGGRRRGWVGLLQSEARSSTFQVSATTGFFLWGLGVLAGAFTGRTPGGDLAGAVLGAAAGGALGVWLRLRRGGEALPGEFAAPTVPRRLRPQGEGEPPWSPAPTQGTIEIPSPAVPGSSPFPQPPSLPEKALPAPEVFALSGWAVLRESDELHDVGLLGRIAARFMGVPVADATRRIRQTRGVIARGLAKDAALALAAELSGNGVQAFAVDERESGGLPELAYMRSCTCGPDGLHFETPEGARGTYLWRQILVIAAARLDEEDEFLVNTGEVENPFSRLGSMPSTSRRVTHTTVIDAVIAHPSARIRIASRESSAAGLRPFAASILDARGSTPVNKGLSVIAGRGSWGYLAFSSPRAFEEHLWWLTQVIRRRSAPRVAERPVPGDGVAGWLE